MDEYLDCLFQYVSENLLQDTRLDLLDYNHCRFAQDMAWSALEKALTPDQLKLVEDYRSTWCDLQALEDQLLFQKAVSLGKWMAQA